MKTLSKATDTVSSLLGENFQLMNPMELKELEIELGELK